jgi:DNA adenine methylase Dam
MLEFNILEPPTNYTESKHKLIPQLIKYFPKDVDIFYDVFCGGLSVTINTNYNRYVSNDIITPLIGFYLMLYSASKEDRIDVEISKILEFKIPKDSQDIYNKLRLDFNVDKDPYKLFSLMCSCTNNLMRFNKKLGFNQTWGKRNISDKTVNKLQLYMDRLKDKDVVFTNYSFEELFKDRVPTKNDFVYCDIPYEGTDCGYGVFSKETQKLFFENIDDLNSKGIRFAISNVSIHKGIINPNMGFYNKYNVVELEHDYEKVAKMKGGVTKEILITNY